MEEDNLKALAADTITFGKELALRVAAKLEDQFLLGYGHRDYCGMGMAFRNGKYYYGALWDGGFDLDQPVVYQDREAFVYWLAAQSTASLARLDDPDVFYRGNQVITRQRLEDFLQQRSASFD